LPFERRFGNEPIDLRARPGGSREVIVEVGFPHRADDLASRISMPIRTRGHFIGIRVSAGF
jgi:hypothetical protein